jgi:hypothetical protein
MQEQAGSAYVGKASRLTSSIGQTGWHSARSIKNRTTTIGSGYRTGRKRKAIGDLSNQLKGGRVIGVRPEWREDKEDFGAISIAHFSVLTR